MTTNVIILAQGEQRRIPDLRTPKQLLRLPACGNTPILDRTLRMLWSGRFGEGLAITVVGWPLLNDHYAVHPVPVGGSHMLRPSVVSLGNPGNSSLKGLWNYFRDHPAARDRRTVVLLGDVVYSWNVLEALLEPGPGPVFAVSNDISFSSGELWGIAWHPASVDGMMLTLDQAMAKHPQQTIYQPGQMRLWLWEVENDPVSHVYAIRYVTDSTEGDYTADIDLPRHTTAEFLVPLSQWAAEDDAAHGVVW